MHAHRNRRGRETVRALFVAVGLLALLGSGSFARAADEASPVAPAAVVDVAAGATAPTVVPTATSAVQEQATGTTATLTVRYWICEAVTTSSTSQFYPDGSAAPASAGPGCHAVPYLYYNEISVGLNDAAGNPLLTIASTNGTAIFQNIAAGDYQIVSHPQWDGDFADTTLTLAAGDSSVLDEIESTPLTADLQLSYRTCETDAPQAGTYAFSFSTFTSAADTTATCQPGPLPTDTSVAVTLTSTTSYGPIDLTSGATEVQIPVDTYMATLNLNGTNVATSDPMTFDTHADYASLQITHYVSRGTFPTQVPDVNGYGTVYVSSQFCTDASRDGDVSIEVGTLTFSTSDATNRCQMAYGQTGRLELVDTVTGDIYDEPEFSGYYENAAVAFYGIPGGTYVVKDLPSGAESDPIVVTTNTYDYFAQVSYYQTAPQVGTAYFVLLNCLDNDRAGQVDFTLFDPGTVNASGTSSNCEYADYGDGLTYTLTNTSTNDTYTFIAYGNDDNSVTLPVGTYTVTTSDGSVSAPFTLNITSVSPNDDFTILLSRYVSDDQWVGPGVNDNEEDGIDPWVYPQLCPSLSGQATGNFILANSSSVEAGAASTTTSCQNGFAFPVQFELIPQSGDTTPIPLVASNGDTAFTLPKQTGGASAADVVFYPVGLYVVHELNTDSYSAPFYLNDTSDIYFLWAQAAPTATATTVPTATIVPTTPPTLAPGVTPSATPAPSVTVTVTPTATAAAPGTLAATPVPGKAVPTAAPGTKVTALPNTGQGTDGNNNSLALLLFGTLSLLLLVVAFGARRQRR